ncbi:MAG: glycosyltransferase family 4 protein [Lachnospiraceae bacterium]|nr:glycosyltransferase family 4 protein [Lachnospiraceae bacterium]
MIIGIDLLWLRPGIVGGTESFIRNLMNGFAMYDTEDEFVLFAASDNAESFKEYEAYPNMSLCICDVECKKVANRILWENRKLDKVASGYKPDVMFIPVYSKPRSTSKLPYVSVIHDLQALHYPAFFSRGKRLFLESRWKYTCKTSKAVVTDSNYCKKDLLKRYPFTEGKVHVLPVPVCPVLDKNEREEEILDSMKVKKGEYYYCVSSLLPHKNLNTLLKVISALKKTEPDVKLLLSGVGGNTKEFDETLKTLGIEEHVISTGYVSGEKRDVLYRNCKLFLFPSIFEGFGMPPIEAMMLGKRVVMTKETCLSEITKNKAVYVNEPYNVGEWVDKIKYAQALDECKESFEEYSLKQVTDGYVRLLRRTAQR